MAGNDDPCGILNGLIRVETTAVNAELLDKILYTAFIAFMLRLAVLTSQIYPHIE